MVDDVGGNPSPHIERFSGSTGTHDHEVGMKLLAQIVELTLDLPAHKGDLELNVFPVVLFDLFLQVRL